MVAQSGHIVGCGVGLRPVVYTLARHPQRVRDLGDRLPSVKFEDRQGAPVVTGVLGLVQLGTQPAPLGRRQSYFAHGQPPEGGYQAPASMSKTFCGSTY